MYSILATPFLWLTDSYATTAFCLDVFSWLIFFSALWTVSKECFQEKWIANIFIITVGFFIYPHQLDSTPKDTLAIGLVFWSAYLTYKFISETFSTIRTILLCVTLLSLGLVKFLYTPLVVLFLLLILASGLNRDHKKLIASLLVTIVCISLAVLTKYLINDALMHGPNIAIVSDGTLFKKGFFPENLSSFFPFISSSIVNTSFLAVQAEKIFSFPFATTIHVFRVVDIVAAIGLIIPSLILWKKIKLPRLLQLLLATSFAVICIVFYMSFRHEAFNYKGSTSYFTYVREARSFLLPMLTLQLLLFFCLFKLPGRQSIRFILLLVVGLECLHGAYFTIKHLLKQDVPQSSAKAVTTKSLQQMQNQLNMNVATTDNALRRYMEMENMKVYAVTYDCIEYTGSNPLIIAAPLADAFIIEKCLLKVN